MLISRLLVVAVLCLTASRSGAADSVCVAELDGMQLLAHRSPGREGERARLLGRLIIPLREELHVLPTEKPWQELTTEEKYEEFKHLCWIVRKLAKTGARGTWSRYLMAWLSSFLEAAGPNASPARIVQLLEADFLIR